MHARHYLGLLVVTVAWGFNFAVVTGLMLLGGALTPLGVAIVLLRRPRVIAPGTKGGVSV
jgi:hypothetical protein